MLVMGIDGGGTKTTALLADEEGHVLGRGHAGSSNYHAIGLAATEEALMKGIQAAFADAGQTPRRLAAVCLGLAGVDRPEDQALIRAWAREAQVAKEVILVNDGAIVLAEGTPENWGVAVVSGTGSFAWGRTPQGITARAGGWGHLLGDEGSGYAIALEALRAIARATDGRGRPTALSQAILSHLGLPSPAALIGYVYGHLLSPAEVATLGPLVDQAAEAGDEVGAEILRRAGEELGLAAAMVAKRLGLGCRKFPLALAGGVLCRSARVQRELLTALERRGWEADPVSMVAEPARGAVRLALAQQKQT